MGAPFHACRFYGRPASSDPKMAEPIRDTDANVKMIFEIATKPDHTEAVGEFYDKWAEHYDEDLGKEYYCPKICAGALGKLVSDRSALIVDCAAGTGQVGQELAKLGFKRIDAVDISPKSLDISASKKVYERLICDSLGKNKLEGVEDGYYTGLVCVAGLAAAHVPPIALLEFTRIVKKDGFLVFTIGKVQTADNQQHQSMRTDAYNELQSLVNDLVRRGVCELVEKVDITYYCEHEAEMCTLRRL